MNPYKFPSGPEVGAVLIVDAVETLLTRGDLSTDRERYIALRELHKRRLNVESHADRLVRQAQSTASTKDRENYRKSATIVRAKAEALHYVIEYLCERLETETPSPPFTDPID